MSMEKIKNTNANFLHSYDSNEIYHSPKNEGKNSKTIDNSKIKTNDNYLNLSTNSKTINNYTFKNPYYQIKKPPSINDTNSKFKGLSSKKKFKQDHSSIDLKNEIICKKLDFSEVNLLGVSSFIKNKETREEQFSKTFSDYYDNVKLFLGSKTYAKKLDYFSEKENTNNLFNPYYSYFSQIPNNNNHQESSDLLSEVSNNKIKIKKSTKKDTKKTKVKYIWKCDQQGFIYLNGRNFVKYLSSNKFDKISTLFNPFTV